MTLEDMILITGIIIQGRVNLKLWDENGDEVMSMFIEDFEYEHDKVPDELWKENKVKYMYYAADALQIEIVKED